MDNSKCYKNVEICLVLAGELTVIGWFSISANNINRRGEVEQYICTCNHNSPNNPHFKHWWLDPWRGFHNAPKWRISPKWNEELLPFPLERIRCVENQYYCHETVKGHTQWTVRRFTHYAHNILQRVLHNLSCDNYNIGQWAALSQLDNISSS